MVAGEAEMTGLWVADGRRWGLAPIEPSAPFRNNAVSYCCGIAATDPPRKEFR
jgi:hypothetical protein